MAQCSSLPVCPVGKRLLCVWWANGSCACAILQPHFLEVGFVLLSLLESSRRRLFVAASLLEQASVTVCNGM